MIRATRFAEWVHDREIGAEARDEAALEASYREMAADLDREAEASMWCEGLIGDASR